VTRAALEVLVGACLPCHHPESDDKKAVRDWPDALDLPATLAAEDFVTPGDAEDSLLFLMVDDGDMPPEDWLGVDGTGGALSATQHAALRDWIDAGAALPSPNELQAARQRGSEVLARVAAQATGQAAETPARVAPDQAHDLQPPTAASWGSRLLRFVGRTHSALVHFPIAFIYGAALAELLLLLGICASMGLAHAQRFCLYLAAISALPAAGVGWILGESKRSELTLTQHRWLGVASAVLCILCLVASEKRRRAAGPGPWTRWTPWLIFLTAALVAVTGHWGGVLTFGEQYFEF